MYLLPHPGMNTPAIFYLNIYSATVLDTPPLISSQLSHLMQVEREVCVCVAQYTTESKKATETDPSFTRCPDCDL